jgi:hypothetical protein
MLRASNLSLPPLLLPFPTALNLCIGYLLGELGILEGVLLARIVSNSID